MPSAEQIVRVVVVSPGDVTAEREALQTVVDELNRQVAPSRGCRVSLWRWETDARPGLHLLGPQGLIDDAMDIESADVVIGIFWKRFGTPTHEARSGTEHELRRAWAAWDERGAPDVMVYFCARPYTPESSGETEQWGRVLGFREAMPEQQLCWRYGEVADFEALVREHLTAFLLRRVADPAPAPATSARVRFNLPLTAATFTGRGRELDALDEALGVADRAVVTQSITGLGGVGKSQLAARYVHQHADAYDVVAWIRAEDGGIADLAELALKLGLPADDPSPQARADRALEWLAAAEERWLLVLDNVGSADQLAGCCPRGGNGRVLVTSRDRELAQFGPVLPVDVFDEDTAVEYLVSRAARPDDEAGARRLAHALGSLPLALSHAGAYCVSGTSFDDYRELLGVLPAAELFDTAPEATYAQTVASTWKVSIAAAVEAAPLAADALAMAAHLGPDGIPKSLFDVLVEDGAPGRKRLADALNALARFNLATVDDTTVSVHRLLQKTVRDDSGRRDDPARHALEALDKTFPKLPAVPADWPLSERLLPHILALAESSEVSSDAGEGLIRLLNAASHYLIWVQSRDRAILVAELALHRAERVLGSDHRDTLTARNRVAFSYLRGHRISEATGMFESLAADAARVLGTADPQTLVNRQDLAVAYRDSGRNDDAITLLELLLSDQLRLLGAEDEGTLSVRHDLALSYSRAGRVDESIAMFEQLVADRARVLGHDHPSTLTARQSLAQGYVRSGRAEQANAAYEPLIADHERVLGADHPNTVSSRYGLAYLHLVSGRADEAITILEPLIADYERVFGTEDPATEHARLTLVAARARGQAPPGGGA